MITEKNHRAIPPRFVMITGLSGSGMSSATNAFEDLGYFCVDNLPVTMLSTFARLLLPNDEEIVSIEKAALVIDIRERQFLSDFPDELKRLRKKKLEPSVLFFEASDEVLQRRFSETRRPHPADRGNGLLAAVREERDAMDIVRKNADLIIDTSTHTVHTLRHFLVQRFGLREDGNALHVQIVSFGHKFGVPGQVDLLFDVRHLPNPYFVKGLRELPGTNPKVSDYLEEQSEVGETIRRFTELLEYLIPLYRREGKSYLTIGVGCTGGRHRSVMVAERLGKALANDGVEMSVMHRDIQK
ncbi:MAG: RNase adapter RapZ [Acidobacteria bacterium]|nr:RNase adapter RapZ [Acidobacteriota bacterium]MBK8811358.1 RNase adapter RapZ [Acidobacteriota bacterium]